LVQRAESEVNVIRTPAALSLAVVALAGCDPLFGRSCTFMSCGSVLAIEVADAPPGDRDFDVTVTVDGEARTCAGVVGPEGLSCEEVQIAASEGGYTITVGLGASLEGEPAPVLALTLGWDGTVVYDGALDVSWGQPVYPNGEGCEPVCFPGHAEVTIEP
jgi:hypothetical protein